jgi:hypothetical protein
MNGQRVTVIRKEGAPPLEREIEQISALSALGSPGTGGNMPPIAWLQMMGYDTATVGVGRHYFRLDNRRATVLDVCRQGIELLKNLLQ